MAAKIIRVNRLKNSKSRNECQSFFPWLPQIFEKYPGFIKKQHLFRNPFPAGLVSVIFVKQIPEAPH
jgi:hypothetical protein